MILVLEVVEGKLEEVVGHMKEVSGCSMKKVMGRMKKMVGCMKELLDHMKSSIEAQVLDSSGFSDILPQVCGPHQSQQVFHCMKKVSDHSMKKLLGHMKKMVGCMKELLDHMMSEVQVLDSSGFSDILPQV